MSDLAPVPEMRLLKNDIALEVVAAGPLQGPLVILLHGFPDVWQTWKNQIAPLVLAGFRVLVPHQRGYGRSDKPSGIAAYDLDHLATDVLSLADSEGRHKFLLIGHDWGGIVAWWTAACAPDRVVRLALLNAPHPGVLRKYLRTHLLQILKSWYVAWFQIPWLPEKMLQVNCYAGLIWAIKFSGPGRLRNITDRQQLFESWSQPGALTAMINYYRALRSRNDQSFQRRLQMPVLILFSKKDPALETGLALASRQLCDDARIIWFDRAHHWLQCEEAPMVTQHLLDFLAVSD